MTSEVITSDRDARRSAALLKAIGLDRVPPEQREIALAIAKRYELDLLLKHLVLVDGRPYVTRDGLLHVAHRSAQLDGIEVTDPELVDMPGQGTFWRATASVFRKDMSRPFRYTGRYPAKGGGNQRFAPEMAVKVAEVMALRRAFDVSAPVIEERWDMEATVSAPAPTLREAIASTSEGPTEGPPVGPSPESGGPAPSGDPATPMPDTICGAVPEEDHPLGMTAACELRGTHRVHRSGEGSWPK